MLHAVPVITNQIAPTGHRMLVTGKRPYMTYRTVTIKLPKMRAIAVINRAVRNVQRWKNKAHMVRAHWRGFLKKDSYPCARHAHDWLTDGTYRLCQNPKCEAEARYIEEHKRGDESLGWVKHDYVLDRT